LQPREFKTRLQGGRTDRFWPVAAVGAARLNVSAPRKGPFPSRITNVI
jgi:hypothetical protein